MSVEVRGWGWMGSGGKGGGRDAVPPCTGWEGGGEGCADYSYGIIVSLGARTLLIGPTRGTIRLATRRGLVY